MRSSGSLQRARKPGTARCIGLQGKAQEVEFLCLNMDVELGALCLSKCKETGISVANLPLLDTPTLAQVEPDLEGPIFLLCF